MEPKNIIEETKAIIEIEEENIPVLPDKKEEHLDMILRVWDKLPKEIQKKINKKNSTNSDIPVVFLEEFIDEQIITLTNKLPEIQNEMLSKLNIERYGFMVNTFIRRNSFKDKDGNVFSLN